MMPRKSSEVIFGYDIFWMIRLKMVQAFIIIMLNCKQLTQYLQNEYLYPF